MPFILTLAMFTAISIFWASPAMAAMFGDLDSQGLLNIAILIFLIMGIILPVRWIMDMRKQRAQKEEAKEAEEYDIFAETGVRGWLLLFVVLSGLGVLRDIVLGFPELINTSKTYPELAQGMNYYLAFSTIYNGVWLYGIYLIYKIKPDAVKFIKKLLLINPLMAVLSPVIMTAFVQATLGEALFNLEIIQRLYTPQVCGGIAASTLSSIIWYIYFVRSVRVKNTYKQN